MPILKQCSDKFVAIPNETAQNTNLSIEALGALTRMTSYSDNYQFKVEWLQTQWGRGRDSVRKILRELREGGYLKMTAIQNEDGSGTFLGQEWYVSTTPKFLGEGDRPPGLPEDGGAVGRSDRGTVNQEDNKKEGTTKKEESPKKEENILSKAKNSVDEKTQEIFLFWKEAMSLSERTTLSTLRKSKITARLRQGYTADEIKQAITACSQDAWHVEHGKNDIEYICRNEVNLDRFIALGGNGNQPKQQTLIDGFIDPAPPPDFADSMQIQKYFFDTGGEDAELYQDRPTYEKFKAGWLPVFEKRSAEYFELAKQQIKDYEESEAFKRRFNGEM